MFTTVKRCMTGCARGKNAGNLEKSTHRLIVLCPSCKGPYHSECEKCSNMYDISAQGSLGDSVPRVFIEDGSYHVGTLLASTKTQTPKRKASIQHNSQLLHKQYNLTGQRRFKCQVLRFQPRTNLANSVCKDSLKPAVLTFFCIV